MCFDPDRALDHLAADPPATTAWPAGAPAADFLRSPAASRVGRLAADQGLFLFHFEHRAHLPLAPEFLAPDADPGLAAPPEWEDGRLPEAKYQSFRHDLRIGSFHPGHRGKWTTHELCHALVGCAWRPGASPLFHATAARLAELLPVVLYYFLDEVRLRACPDHAGGGPLFSDYCAACERLAVEGPAAPSADDRDAVRDAARYLDKELAAIARTRRLGRPIGHRWGSLDLCTDGLAYAAAHGARLGSRPFARFADQFLQGPAGAYADLDALEARVVAVARAIAVGEPLPPLVADPASGRWRWVVQDVGWRLIEARTVAARSFHRAADAVIDALAAATPGEAAVAKARERWPLGPEVFDVGYPLLGSGSSAPQLDAGLRAACPLVMELFDDAGHDPVPAFAAADPAVREPIGDRFAAWLAAGGSEMAATLAAFEASLRYAASDPLVGVLGAGEGLRSGVGVRALSARWDPVEISDRAESGELTGRWAEGRLHVEVADGDPVTERPTRLLVARDAAGEVAVVDEDPADPTPLDTLVELRVVGFDRWRAV